MCRRPKHHWIESILLIKWQMQHIFYLQLMIRSGILPKLSGLTVPFIFPCFLRKNTSFLHWNTAGNSREYKRNKCKILLVAFDYPASYWENWTSGLPSFTDVSLYVLFRLMTEPRTDVKNRSIALWALLGLPPFYLIESFLLQEPLPVQRPIRNLSRNQKNKDLWVFLV